MAKVIMIQGTMSNVGKSFLCAGLCRIFKQDGYKAAPFKSQNMALNSYITEKGLEMGRAQAMQAEAAGLQPSVLMNPILLKPTSEVGSQVIVNGKVLGNMKAEEYFSYKKRLIPEIKRAFAKLAKEADIIVVEGAGSPAEINLKENDIVNMGMAGLVDAPVLLVGDIDRGGVFAQLLGTLMLLEESEKKRIKGFIINKFRGDKTILNPGISMLEERGGILVCGVVPYMNLALEDEDSLTARFDRKQEGRIDLAVIRYPRISNFTDFDVFEQIEGISIRYVTSVVELHQPDMVFLPGSKNSIMDLQWMRGNGLEAAVKKLSKSTIIFGICGGYQMLGRSIKDPYGVEEGGEIRGMELLPVDTVLQKNKTTAQVTGQFQFLTGALKALSGLKLSGYEIHMGKTAPLEADGFHRAEKQEQRAKGLAKIQNLQTGEKKEDGTAFLNVYGSYIHGIFDGKEAAGALVEALAARKGISIDLTQMLDYRQFKETQYDKLADTLKKYLDVDYIYRILQEARIG